MFAINNTKTFKDSVHGYIEVPKCFVDALMDNEYFQRLRNVEQTGMRVLYPNAKHDRFSHSLGVFHLGHRAVDALLENFSKDQYWNIESDNQSVLYWAKNKVLFLIACLLHDIGHAPFSHSLEAQLLHNTKPPVVKGKKSSKATITEGDYITLELQRLISEYEKDYMKYKYNEDAETTELNISKVAPHEQIGAMIVLNDFFQKQIINIFDCLHQDNYPRPEGESILYAEYYQDKIVLDTIDKNDKNSMIVFKDDLCFIARMIMGLKYDDWRPERQIRNCFIELLNGQNFDVDKLDYIVRDTQMSGINNISLDVDRLVSSLCIVTKTKHLNKLQLDNKQLSQTTIVHIANSNPKHKLEIGGHFHGIFAIKKGTEIVIKSGSKIESLVNTYNGEAKIHYGTSKRAVFTPDAIVRQDSELLSKEENAEGKDIIILLGKNAHKSFSCSIDNGILLDDFHFVADEDLKIKIHENCSICITGLFNSEGPVRIFNMETLKGDISEVEVLGDTFKQEFTNIKVPGKYGYNTFTIGFKKKAINVIANVMDARNYLYLWIYAHHKVIYYANFLIPVLVNELLPPLNNNEFPNLSLDYNNITSLDDTYIWTALRYHYYPKKTSKTIKQNEIKKLLNELFTRCYKKSLYKSLAEYDLFFEKYDQTTMNKLQEYINSKLSNTKPYIDASSHNKNKYEVGYMNKQQMDVINDEITKTAELLFENKSEGSELYKNMQLTDLVYVAVNYKRKQLETLKTYIDMKDDIIPISQIPLLETQSSKSISNSSNTYFYLYYQTNLDSGLEYESEIVKTAIKAYFDNIVETKIKK